MYTRDCLLGQSVERHYWSGGDTRTSRAVSYQSYARLMRDGRRCGLPSSFFVGTFILLRINSTDHAPIPITIVDVIHLTHIRQPDLVDLFLGLIYESEELLSGIVASAEPSDEKV